MQEQAALGPAPAPSNAGRDDTERAVRVLAARLPAVLTPLAHVAYDFAWSWQAESAALFRDLDPLLWHATDHNPVRLLLEASPDALERAARDPEYVARAERLRARLEAARAAPAWTPEPISEAHPAAFLCAEFGVHVSLPIYAGGLGALAGDFLKEASDRRLPLVGVGIFYRSGYFHQRLDLSGWQHEFWIESRPHVLPLALVTNGEGVPLTVRVHIRGRDVVLQVWRAAIGRTSLYLLDAQRPENSAVDRWITSRLYEAQPEIRLAQYAVLGIGGLRALEAIGVEPSVVHLNEGHAALATFELTRRGREAGLSPEAALDAARERLVFTTHTPVAAGNETYAPELIAKVLGDLPGEAGLDRETFLGLGRFHPGNRREPSGMTVLALRSSRRANGVSRRHGEVARRMWKPLWPERAAKDVPIGHVTNGVHIPSWMAPAMRQLLDRHLGEGWEERADDPAIWRQVDSISDEELWAVRSSLRRKFVDFVRERSVFDRLRRSEEAPYVEAAARCFGADVLTLGFARRVASYKRLHLLTHQADRALALLSNHPPIQIVIAGKAHPRDDEAKGVLRNVFGVKSAPVVGERVAFLEDYDLDVASRLVAGCDIWVNVPRPPLEASGTSGMKSVLNGGLQLSVRDGWWAEAEDAGDGWSLPDDPTTDEAARDARDAALLLDLIERQILPLFHDRDDAGLPRAWLARIRTSLRTHAPRFCATRMLRDYVSGVYPTSGGGAPPP